MFSNYSTHHNGSNDSDCVVDGDTFWSRGQKIQIAGTDTPELSPLRCEAERVKGEAANARLLALPNAGSFSLSTGLRDEDGYGRKLRTVLREGHSLGEVLIAGRAGEAMGRRTARLVLAIFLKPLYHSAWPGDVRRQGPAGTRPSAGNALVMPYSALRPAHSITNMNRRRATDS